MNFSFFFFPEKQIEQLNKFLSKVRIIQLKKHVHFKPPFSWGGFFTVIKKKFSLQKVFKKVEENIQSEG